MNEHPLDNPVWHSLTSRHRQLAQAVGETARYDAAVAPFVAVRSPDAGSEHALRDLVAVDESVLFVGPASELTEDWEIRRFAPIAQMTCETPLPLIEGPPLVALEGARIPDMLALTALVYPHYFRPRTVEMGSYLGIYDGAHLVAMAGERMGFPGFQEISAICTHPQYLGRGYAQRLLATLNNRALARGEVPFLHVSHENARAKGVYELMGYVQRCDIDLVQVTRRI